MTRILVVLLAAFLAIAPAAAAKGPHAILTSGPDALEPGTPWVATVELNEFRRAPHPRMIATQGARTVTAKVEKAASSIDGARAFKLTTVFPTDGRWKLTLVAGEGRLRFPAVNVGSGDVPQDYVAFPVGSEAARQGGGGVYMEQEQEPVPVEPGDNGVQSPQVFKAYEGSDDSGDEATLRAWWLLPVAGVVLAGAGVATVRRRGSR
jgi:hypothetical protein